MIRASLLTDSLLMGVMYGAVGDYPPYNFLLNKLSYGAFINLARKAYARGLLSIRTIMRHYEIVFLVHPDQSEQVPGMLERYEGIIHKHNGVIHRKEDWGRRQLAYPMQDVHKAHYIMLNIECNQQSLDELKNAFKFNDAILRNLIILKKEAIKTESVMMKKESKDARDVA